MEELCFVVGAFVGIGIGFVAAQWARDFSDDDSAPVMDSPTDVPSDQFPVYREFGRVPMSEGLGKGME